MKMHEIIDGLSLEDVEEMGEVLLTFMHGFRPGGPDINWVIDFFLLDTELLFKWAGFIDQTIGVSFPSGLYRERAHLFGDLIQKRFDEEQLGIVLVHPLFLFIGIFVQVVRESSLICFEYKDDPEKVEAVLKLDYYLNNKVIVDHSVKRFVLIPGYGDLFDLANHIIDMDLFDLASIHIYQATMKYPISLPTDNIHIHLYGNLTTKHHSDNEQMQYYYY